MCCRGGTAWNGRECCGIYFQRLLVTAKGIQLDIIRGVFQFFHYLPLLTLVGAHKRQLCRYVVNTNRFWILNYLNHCGTDNYV